MQLTEQHILSGNDSRFVAVDRAAFAAKNLYNAANYLVRQSFIDEPICHHERYAGKRIKRGLFCAADGRQIINADVNGAYNIIRKAIPGAFGQGKAGVVVHPVGIAPTN